MEGLFHFFHSFQRATPLFLRLLNMSITAGYLVLAVVALRFFLKKASKGICCILWAFVALRLLVPISIESVFSVIPDTTPVTQDMLQFDVPVLDSVFSDAEDLSDLPLEDIVLTPPTGTSDSSVDFSSVATGVWLFGVAVMAGYFIFSYLRIWVRVKESVRLRANIWLSDKISTPFILGVFRPRIYLPHALEDEVANHVIAHEKAHLKRLDHIWKPLGYVLLTVYWFHPAMWLAYILLCKDLELACDERVIRQRGTDIKKSYCDALISCSINRTSISACPLAFGEGNVKARVKSVLNYKKPAFWVVIAAVTVISVTAVGLLTNPKTTDAAPDGDSYRLELMGGKSYDLRNLENGKLTLQTTLVNEGRDTLICDSKFRLFRHGEEILPEENAVWDNVSYSVGPNSSAGFFMDLGIFADHMTESGEYTLTKEFCYQGNPEQTYTATAEFYYTDGYLSATDRMKICYPQYFNLDIQSGLEVHIWKVDDAYACGLTAATGRKKTKEEIKGLTGISPEEMKIVLGYYRRQRNLLPGNVKLCPCGFQLTTQTLYTLRQSLGLWSDGLVKLDVGQATVYVNGILPADNAAETLWNLAGEAQSPTIDFGTEFPVVRLDSAESFRQFLTATGSWLPKAPEDTGYGPYAEVLKEFTSKEAVSLLVIYVPAARGQDQFQIQGPNPTGRTVSSKFTIDGFAPGADGQEVSGYFITVAAPSEMLNTYEITIGNPHS